MTGENNTPYDGEESKSTLSTELGEMKDFGKAPDGGLRAWLVAVGAGCVFFSALGFANAFGVFQEYYMAHQLREESADKIAWIGSLAAFLQFAAGAIGGPMFDRFGPWVCLPSSDTMTTTARPLTC
jgi:hypothetical protein